MTLRTRWLGRVPYRDALRPATGLHAHSPDDHLLLLEHPHVYTLGVRADLGHVLVPPADGRRRAGAHRPGRRRHLPRARASSSATRSCRCRPSGAAGSTGWPTPSPTCARSSSSSSTPSPTSGCPAPAGCASYPGVWVDPDGDDPRKIAAIGVRLTRGRSMHGFALNVGPDLRYCSATSCRAASPTRRSPRSPPRAIDVSLREVVDAVAARAAALWGGGRGDENDVDRRDVVWRHRPDDLSAFSRGEGPGQTISATGRTVGARRRPTPATGSPSGCGAAWRRPG